MQNTIISLERWCLLGCGGSFGYAEPIVQCHSFQLRNGRHSGGNKSERLCTYQVATRLEAIASKLEA